MHGNLPALEAVLADAPDADLIVIGGDVVGGPRVAEAVERLRALGDGALWVRGNAERELVEPSPPGPGAPPPGVIEETKRQLTAEQIDFLIGLPEQLELEVPGLGRVLFCHATPRSDEEIVTPLTPGDRLADVLVGVQADVVVAGHTHMQDERVIGGVRFVNAGSVGKPYEPEPGAYWAMLGPGVELRRTPYAEAEAPEAGRKEAAEYFESLVG